MLSRVVTLAFVLALSTLAGCYQGIDIDGFADLGTSGEAGEGESEDSSDGGEDNETNEAPDPGPSEEGSEDPSEPAPGEPPPAPPQPDPPGEAAACGLDLVWPTTGSKSAQTIVHDAYGPRVLDDVYDWHLGIDLPGHPDDEGFIDPVYAIADGELYAIGNPNNDGVGAIASYGPSAGSVIVLEHPGAALGPDAPTLYSVYMHLDALPLDAFWARVGDAAPGPVDLREYYYLGGAGTSSENRGRRRPTLKTGGAPIEAYPRVDQSQPIAQIGDTGASYEHLHFELREGTPTSAGARNPYAYLPHHNQTIHAATLDVEPGLVRARIEIPREPGPMAALTDLDQQIDVEEVALQIVDGQGEVVDELSLRFFDVGLLDNAEFGELDLDGVAVSLWPDDFTSAEPIWALEIDFTLLELAGLVPGPGEHFALAVTDVCGNRVLAS